MSVNKKVGSIHYDLGLNTSKFDAGMRRVKTGIKVGTVAIVAGLGASIKVAADFEKRMADVATLMSGDSTDAIKTMSKGILDLTKSIPKSADDLGASAYAIVSAGITDTADAMNVLEQSAKLGTAGLGTTEEATTLMTLALNNFRDSGLSANEVSDVLFKTVKNGITTVGQMSQSFGLVAPLAVDAGVSIQELSAATAALTQVNKSASISQNSIKAAFVSLNKPTADAIKLFDKLGVRTFKELIKKSGGMVNAFKKMKEASGDNEAAFAGAIGSGEAYSSVLALLGSQSGAFTEALADMTKGNNAVDEAFQKQKKTFSATYQILKNNLTRVMIQLGSAILPTLVSWGQALAEDVLPKLVAWFSRVWPAIKEIAIQVGQYLLPKLKNLWERIVNDLIPALADFMKNPIVRWIAVTLVGAIGLLIDALGFIADHIRVLMPIMVAWGILMVGSKIRGAILSVSGALTGTSPKSVKSALLNVKKLMGSRALWQNAARLGVVAAAIWAAGQVAGAVNAMNGALKATKAKMASLQGSQDAYSVAQRAILLSNKTEAQKLTHINSLRRSKGFPNLVNLNPIYSKLGLASGKTNFGGGLVRVGETGPELVRLPKGSDIFNATQTEQSGAGGITNFNGQVNIAKEVDAGRIMAMLGRSSELASRGVFAR